MMATEATLEGIAAAIDEILLQLADLHVNMSHNHNDISAIHMHVDSIRDTDLPAIRTDTANIKLQTDHLSFVTGAGAQDIKALVEVYSNPGRTAFVARGRTNTLGIVTFNLAAGTYYLKVWVPGQPLSLDMEVVA